MSEGRQPAELGWGTHEKKLPSDGRRHDSGCDAAIYLNRPGASTRVSYFLIELCPKDVFFCKNQQENYINRLPIGILIKFRAMML